MADGSGTTTICITCPPVAATVEIVTDLAASYWASVWYVWPL